MSLDRVEKAGAAVVAVCAFALICIAALAVIGLVSAVGWWVVVAAPVAAFGIRLCYRAVVFFMDEEP